MALAAPPAFRPCEAKGPATPTPANRCQQRSPAILPFYNPPMHEVVVYSRNGCHLCEVVKDTLARLQSSADFHWRAIDIDADPQLRAQYNDQVPVVFIDGRKSFKYHLDPDRFLRALSGRS